MFELTESDECYWPVQLPRVTEAGEVELCEVLIRYRIFSRAEQKTKRFETAQRLADQLAEAVKNPDGATDRTAALAELRDMDDANEAEVRQRITGWKGITRNNEEVPYSDEVLDRLLAHTARFEALRSGLYEASRGARAKN